MTLTVRREASDHFHQLPLLAEEGVFAICRLGCDAPIPPWATAGQVFSITRTPDELSIVCRQDAVPEGTVCERGWLCLRVARTLPFTVVGVLASLTAPLADAGISVFAISTFDTDYVLVKKDDFETAVAALQRAGHSITTTTLTIRREVAADHEPIRHVNRLAFGQDDEARLVDALREGGFVRLSLVAQRAGHVVGHILFSDLPIVTETGTVSALALAPMAVLPALQDQGIGTALVRRGLDECRQQGHAIVVVVGHRQFYPRFGFTSQLAANLASPFSGSESFMAAELVPRALDGVKGRVQYPPPFGT